MSNNLPDLHPLKLLRSGTVSVVLFSDYKKVLLVEDKNKDRKVRWGDKRIWGLPGGKIKTGETIFQCGNRELKEETGLEMKIQSHLVVSQVMMPVFVKPTHDGYHHPICLYTGECEGKLLKEPAYDQDAGYCKTGVPEWVPLEDVLSNKVPTLPYHKEGILAALGSINNSSARLTLLNLTTVA